MYSPIIWDLALVKRFFLSNFLIQNNQQSSYIYSFENNGIVVLAVFDPILVSKTIWEAKYLQNFCIHHTLDDRVFCGKACGKDYSHA